MRIETRLGPLLIVSTFTAWNFMLGRFGVAVLRPAYWRTSGVVEWKRR